MKVVIQEKLLEVKKDSKWYITKMYDILGNIDPGTPYQDIFL